MDKFVENYLTIIDYVKSNSEVIAKLGQEAFYPLFTTTTDKTTVTFTVAPGNIGVINSATLTLKVIALSYDEAIEVSCLINKYLAMNDYKYKTYKNVYFYSEYGGGGCLFNQEYRMYENTIIFNLKWRCI